jgi:hypothetical protein
MESDMANPGLKKIAPAKSGRRALFAIRLQDALRL